LGAAGEPETTQENIQDWLEHDEGVPAFQLLTGEEISAVIFFCSFSSALPILLNFHLFVFYFRATFCFINPDGLTLS
jgi:hypothetical protein